MHDEKRFSEAFNKDHILIVRNLRIWYPVRKLLSIIGYVRAVDDVSFEVLRGKITAIVGESGSGKTTLAKAIIGVIRATSGSIVFVDEEKGPVDITKLPMSAIRKWYSSRVGLVQQDPYAAMPPFMNIKTILEEPMKIHGVPKGERLKRIYELLTEVGLTPPEDFLGKYPHMLSGGQLQRVAIARALALKPQLVLADEPVSMLDASIKMEVLSIFKGLIDKYRSSVLYITHDFATAKHFSDIIMVMYAGQIVEIGGSKEVIRDPKHPYTEALISVLPDPDPGNRYMLKKTLAGEPPSLMNPPKGCRLWPRCPYAMDKCKGEEPPLISIKGERKVKCWLHA